MDIRKLRYFVAIAEEESFTRAAIRLHVSQPPLSSQIKQLEDELGVTLFVRDSRNVRLTNAGLDFLTSARAILSACERAIVSARRADSGFVGEIRVGFVGSASYQILPPLIRNYRKQFPEVTIAVRDMTTPEQIRALVGGDIDIGILRPPIFDERITFQCLVTEQLFFALPADHHLVRYSTLSLSQLRDELIFLSPRHGGQLTYERVASLLNRSGITPSITAEINSVNVMLDLAAAGLGIAVVPETAMAIRKSGVVYRPFPELGILQLGLAFRSASESPLVREFSKVAREMFVDIPGSL